MFHLQLTAVVFRIIKANNNNNLLYERSLALHVIWRIHNSHITTLVAASRTLFGITCDATGVAVDPSKICGRFWFRSLLTGIKRERNSLLCVLEPPPHIRNCRQFPLGDSVNVDNNQSMENVPPSRSHLKISSDGSFDGKIPIFFSSSFSSSFVSSWRIHTHRHILLLLFHRQFIRWIFTWSITFKYEFVGELRIGRTLIIVRLWLLWSQMPPSSSPHSFALPRASVRGCRYWYRFHVVGWFFFFIFVAFICSFIRRSVAFRPLPLSQPLPYKSSIAKIETKHSSLARTHTHTHSHPFHAMHIIIIAGTQLHSDEKRSKNEKKEKKRNLTKIKISGWPQPCVSMQYHRKSAKQRQRARRGQRQSEIGPEKERQSMYQIKIK